MRVKTLPCLVLGGLLLGSSAPIDSGSITDISRDTSEASGSLHGAPYLVAKKKTVYARTILRKRNAHAASLLAGETSGLLPVVDQPDILPKHKQIADEIFKLMPAHCRTALKTFYVRYDNPKQRGLAGKESIVVSGNLPDSEFRALLVHEFAHVLDLGCLKGNPTSGSSGFRDGGDIMWLDDPSVAFYRISWASETAQLPRTTPADFVTGYASWDVFEDIGESLAFYVFHQEAFRARAETNAPLAKKLQWIETYVFPKGLHVAQSTAYLSASLPWDATKLSYLWLPSVPIAQNR